MNKRACSLFILVVLLAFLGCSRETDDQKKETSEQAATTTEIRHGGIYRLPLDIMPTSLDPAYIEDVFGISVAHQIYDGLVQYGPYLNVLPAIARDWQIEEQGKVLRFHLRKEATFHDGEPITASDAVFSLMRLFRIDPAPSILSHLLYIAGSEEYRAKKTDTIRGLKAVSEFELKIELVKPYSPFLGALAMYQAAIVPEHVVSTKGVEAFSTSPVGSGPFKFASMEQNTLIRVERFPAYYAGPSYLDGVEYHIYPGAQRNKVLKDFETGLLEEMQVFGQARATLSQKENLHWVHRPSLSLFFYGINTEHQHMQDSRLRRALSLAINRHELLTTVYDNQFDAAYTVLPPGMPAHSRDVQLVKEDVAQAKDLVAQVAGADSSAPIKVEIVSASQSAFAQAEFKLIQERWASIGIDTSIKYITDWQEFETYLQSDSMQIFRYSWNADMPDPDNFLRPLFGSTSSVNFSRYRNKDVDSLLEEAAATVDEVKRAGFYQQVERKVMEEYPIIPLFYLSIDRVYQSHVNGINSNPLGWQAVRLHRTWLDTASP